MLFIAPRFLITLLLLAATGLGATASASDDSAVAGSTKPASIAWFDGSVDAAFAEAERSSRPLFLYWSAEWCPPCHELKATVFRRDEFIAQSTLFVPVYLDGDTASAQKYGEQFSVYGYPTVIVFAPDGRELTRIPGGMNLEQYLSVLELTLNALTGERTPASC